MAAFRRVVRMQRDGSLGAFRRGGYHAEWWIVELDCGHAFHVAVDPGHTPHRPRKCQVCGYGFVSDRRKAKSDKLLAGLNALHAAAAPRVCPNGHPMTPDDDGCQRCLDAQMAKAEIAAAEAHPKEWAELEAATDAAMHCPRGSWKRPHVDARLAKAQSAWDAVTRSEETRCEKA